MNATNQVIRLGACIKLNRLEKQWSQQDLADRVATTRAYISLLENDKRLPSFDVLEKLAAAFDKGLDVFLGEFSEINERIELALLLQEIAESADLQPLRNLVEFAQTQANIRV